MRLPLPSSVVPDRARTSGQSLVELALTLPLLLAILFGAIDLSRAFQTYIVVTNAAREAARYAGTHPTDTAGAQARAIAEASASGMSACQPSLSVPCIDSIVITAPSPAHNGDQITATIVAKFYFATMYLFRLDWIPISNSATMAVIIGGASP